MVGGEGWFWEFKLRPEGRDWLLEDLRKSIQVVFKFPRWELSFGKRTKIEIGTQREQTTAIRNVWTVSIWILEIS